MQKIFIFYLSSLILLNRCNCDQKPIDIDPDQSHSVCLIACDFSSSLDLSSRQQILLNTKTIFDNLAPTHKIVVYSMDPDVYSAPILESATYSKQKQHSQEVMNNMRQVDQFNVGLSQKLIDSLMQLQKSIHHNSSCILSSVDHLWREAYHFSQSGYDDIKVVFLSDMVEECSSYLGEFNTSEGEFEDGNRMLDSIKYERSKDSLNIKTAIIISSDDRIMVNDFETFWQKAFLKMGYISPVYISANIPVWLE